uniref:arf-GAP with GTPase, ANK repeat and PH domain-containing protein 1-like n=1 Tax=Myxine glutinosa TaxID=7769 RepID=UPI00358EEEB4
MESSEEKQDHVQPRKPPRIMESSEEKQDHVQPRKSPRIMECSEEKQDHVQPRKSRPAAIDKIQEHETTSQGQPVSAAWKGDAVPGLEDGELAVVTNGLDSPHGKAMVNGLETDGDLGSSRMNTNAMESKETMQSVQSQAVRFRQKPQKDVWISSEHRRAPRETFGFGQTELGGRSCSPSSNISTNQRCSQRPHSFCVVDIRGSPVEGSGSVYKATTQHTGTGCSGWHPHSSKGLASRTRPVRPMSLVVEGSGKVCDVNSIKNGGPGAEDRWNFSRRLRAFSLSFQRRTSFSQGDKRSPDKSRAHVQKQKDSIQRCAPHDDCITNDNESGRPPPSSTLQRALPRSIRKSFSFRIRSGRRSSEVLESAILAADDAIKANDHNAGSSTGHRKRSPRSPRGGADKMADNKRQNFLQRHLSLRFRDRSKLWDADVLESTKVRRSDPASVPPEGRFRRLFSQIFSKKNSAEEIPISNERTTSPSSTGSTNLPSIQVEPPIIDSASGDTTEFHSCMTEDAEMEKLNVGLFRDIADQDSPSFLDYLHSTCDCEMSHGIHFKKKINLHGEHFVIHVEDCGAFSNFQPRESQMDAALLFCGLHDSKTVQDISSFLERWTTFRNGSSPPVVLVGKRDGVHPILNLSNGRKYTFYEASMDNGFDVAHLFQYIIRKVLESQGSEKHTGKTSTLPNISVTPQRRNSQYNLTKTGSFRTSTPVRPDGSTLTPTSCRKSFKRRPNIFPSTRGGDAERKVGDEKTEFIGSGRAIPIKQGNLLKWSGTLNKEWKKKYVTLCENGRLTYHPRINEYMQNVNGKAIDLLSTTVKIPGKRPPRAFTSGTSPRTSFTARPVSADDGHSTHNVCELEKGTRDLRPSSVSSTEQGATSHTGTGSSIEDFASAGSNPASSSQTSSPPQSTKQHHRRKRSFTPDALAPEPDDVYEFTIVSLSEESWLFRADGPEEQEAWVSAIQAQILACLQASEGNKVKSEQDETSSVTIQTIINTTGNSVCVDCGAPDPTWASLNLGALMCIECCSGHRALGAHLSRVRSLHLDHWPPGQAGILAAMGNQLANSVWEATCSSTDKLCPNTTRQEKEHWIEQKYKNKAYLAPLPQLELPLGLQLAHATAEGNVRLVMQLVAHSERDDVNATDGEGRTALHVACQQGNSVLAQLLIWYGADTDKHDVHGQTALNSAQLADNASCVHLLLQNQPKP